VPYANADVERARREERRVRALSCGAIVLVSCEVKSEYVVVGRRSNGSLKKNEDNVKE